MRNQREVGEAVYNLLSELTGVAVVDIKPTSNIVLDLDADSLDMVQLINTLEDQFNTTISDSAAESLVTAGDVVEYCCKHQGAGQEL